ncbi:MAG: ABC transporter permease [Thermodesulfobacteriota bacterium]
MSSAAERLGGEPSRAGASAGAPRAGASRPRFGSRQAHLHTVSIAWQLARLDILRRYTATMLGIVWAVLAPLLMSVVIGVVFSQLFGMPLREFLPYLFLNLTLWAFFAACLDSGAIAFLAAEGYIKQIAKVSFYTYPLRMTLAAFFTLLLGLCAVTVVIMVFGGRIGPMWLLAVPGLAAWLLFGFAVCCLSAVLNTAVRDFQYLQSVGVQALFYATPVMFPAALLVKHDLAWLLTWNPLYHLMMIVRVPLLYNDFPEPSHYVASALSLAFFGVAAILAMRMARPRLVFWL